jgi:hypothetical protein
VNYVDGARLGDALGEYLEAKKKLDAYNAKEGTNPYPLEAEVNEAAGRIEEAVLLIAAPSTIG